MAQPLLAETLDLREFSAIHDAAQASEYRRSAAYHGPIAWAHQTEQAHGPSRQRGITTPTSGMVIASWPPMGLPEAMAGVLAR